MTFKYLDRTRDGAVEHLTLNRPDVRNAFNEEVIGELSEWAHAAADDATLRAVVLKGAGPVFSAGADAHWMSKMVGYSREENLADAMRMADMFLALDTLPAAVIGRIHGAALGGGAGLAAICDIVVADEGTVFGFTETKLGILPAVISPYVLPKIGPSVARELFLTGMRFSAARARDIGLVHAVVPSGELDACVEKYVKEVLSASPTGLAAAKRLIPQVWGHAPADARAITAEAIAAQRVSPEGQDGLRAFLEKARAGLDDATMIRRLLIANRGEIALRIIRACREIGIETIAVYSDADRRAPHVLAADVSEHIGPSPAGESYLNVERLLAAARSRGADAVHPGYGFLSERAHFARACRDAGLIFVGPPPEAIERMGSKIGARQLMQQAGVPVVPGETPADQSDASLVASAERIGFPALIKPSAGGGGIGMKTIRNQDDVVEAVQRARREAVAAFGDGTLYIERLVEKPRHVEVQVFADAHGHAVHVFERECSVQRRHQKVIEESPCPALTARVRERMGAAAVAAATVARYVNAGTIEFLLEGEGEDARFFFLEMNTRLQVEHPVTELVAGVDLVRAQLLVAGGEPLPWSQQELSQRGHAIECRIYAEDPAQGFLPQAGPLLMYREPRGPGIRVDAGVREGGEVSVFYDPLLAKLIVAGETRDAAIARAIQALQQYIVLGIRTNIPFLIAILRHPDFQAGRIDTAFLDREQGALGAALVADVPLAAFAAAAVHEADQAAVAGGATPHAAVGQDPFDTLRGWGLS